MTLELARHLDFTIGTPETTLPEILNRLRAAGINIQREALEMMSEPVFNSPLLPTNLRVFDVHPVFLGMSVGGRYLDICEGALSRERLTLHFPEVILHHCLHPEILTDEDFWKVGILMLMRPAQVLSQFCILGLRIHDGKKDIYAHPMNVKTEIPPTQRFLVVKKLPNTPRPTES